MAVTTVADWLINDDLSMSNVVGASASCSLFNRFAGEAAYVRYGEREWGINLVWDTNPVEAFHFWRQDMADSWPLKYDEPIAIQIPYGGSASWLCYTVRNWGINLGWGEAPQLQWRITGGDAGAEIAGSTPCGLYNTVAGDHVIYCEREWGINLRWANDCADRLEAEEESAVPATVSVAYRMGPLSQTQTTTGRVRFRGNLVASGEATSGTTAFDVTDEWIGEPGTNVYHYARYLVGNLKLGRWRIQVESPPGTFRASCEADLTRHGINEAVNFQANLDGCARGFSWPGG